jgi:transcriptional regulator with XRE-family HTH domain
VIPVSEATLKKIGERLRKARLEKGMTQAEVAKQAGMGTNRYAVVERGATSNMTINKLEKICEALGVKGSDIIPF